ncbi:hypothetical protein ACFO4O_06270 [Glaciecola siphonariae]|uniref:Uncharacterized protein n=1 Tax=Glaciecola siphonariae TaxID=521012 RepID=A0ABV9LVT3_9ALTE
MKKKHSIILASTALISSSLLLTAMSANALLDPQGSTVQNSAVQSNALPIGYLKNTTSQNTNHPENAEQESLKRDLINSLAKSKMKMLGVNKAQYAMLQAAASGASMFRSLDGFIDITSHPAMIKYHFLSDSSTEIPDAVNDELSLLSQHNFELAAQDIGVDTADFYQLLIKFVRINNQLDLAASRRTNNEGEELVKEILSTDEPEDEEEVVEVITVTEDSLQALHGGGSAGRWNRLHRNAYNRWGPNGSGTTVAVFSSSSFTFVRTYRYDSGITRAGDSSCFGMCMLTPHP